MIQAVPDRRAEVQKNRWQRRVFRHHLPLFVFTAATISVLYATRPYRDVWMKASFSTAYPALLLIVATLAVGPINVLAKRRNPASIDLRRDIGIWAGLVSLLHSVVGQNVHLRGRPWLYYVYEHWSRHVLPLRHDLFGFSNYSGLTCSLLVLALLATSSDYALRKMGKQPWKKLQRWNYAAFVLLAVHAAGFETIEHQKMPFVVTTALALGTALVLQAAGFLMRRAADQGALVAASGQNL